MPEKAGFLESFSPWSSRSSTPKPNEAKRKSQTDLGLGELAERQTNDHSIPSRPRIRPRDYPSDCPRSGVRWFHAVDAPKRKPTSIIGPPKDQKPLPAPKKYTAFSKKDSRAIEQAFQRLADRDDASGQGGDPEQGSSLKKEVSRNTSINNATDKEEGGDIKVSVNEDYLFDVDVDHRELAPAYWLGPIYDVRRGSWFYPEGSSLRPCEENLATQLEEGYVKVKPWRNPTPGSGKPPSHIKTTPQPDIDDGMKGTESSTDDKASGGPKEEESIPVKFELQTHRLFGTYINSVVTYQDAETAWILSDDLLSRMSSTVYQRFAGGGHLGGTKVVRGFKETGKTKESEKDSGALPQASGNDQAKASKEPLPASEDVPADAPENDFDTEPRLLKLERQVSSLMLSQSGDADEQEASARRQYEDEMKDDYMDSGMEDQGREIEHLVLVTHGIGQRLGLRMESINFIHDVNVLRKTLKSVYQASPDLQALNNEIEKLPKNCRVQVLPVVWRHLLDFPKKSFKHNREQDLTEIDYDEEYPSLDSITVDGVPAIRQLISDLALDILLYQSAYREHISSIVRQECNRVHDLFMERNPGFKGKVSLLGHSLGSAILFDILCLQVDGNSGSPLRSRSRRHSRPPESSHKPDLGLNFEVEDFYCLGSPLGLYQMLKGHLIRGRVPRRSSLKIDAFEDPFLGPASAASQTTNDETLSVGISSPKCARLFNIFHPADPIAYRVEPLVSNAMSSLKPQPLPYTKRGIFGVQGQGFSGIGARVGQSVSGMWSNLTSGVASSLLNRSLGLTADQMTASPTGPVQTLDKGDPSSTGAGRDGVVPDEEIAEHPPTLLDSEKVTLFAEFEKQRQTLQSDGSRDLGESSQWVEAERRSRQLRKEEAKIRALNNNGRIDYSIQEGVFDISLIASIASHLSYWADEDVSHFVISQLLSRQRVIKH